MKEHAYIPTVIDFAYDIISLHKENIFLREKIEHLEKLEDMHRKSLNSSDKHHKEFLGIMFNAVLDPESALNKGQAALMEKELNENPKLLED